MASPFFIVFSTPDCSLGSSITWFSCSGILCLFSHVRYSTILSDVHNIDSLFPLFLSLFHVLFLHLPDASDLKSQEAIKQSWTHRRSGEVFFVLTFVAEMLRWD